MEKRLGARRRLPRRGLLLPPDPALDAALAANAAAGLPAIDVSPLQGKLLHHPRPHRRRPAHPRDRHARRLLDDLARPRAARRTAGSSASRPSPRHAEVARANIAARRPRRPGRGRWSARRSTRLPTLDGPFDLVFIDADKRSNPDYLAWALRLVAPRHASSSATTWSATAGSPTPAARDPGVIGTRRLFDVLAAEPRLTATAVQTVGAKGWDGFAIAVVTRLTTVCAVT